MTHPDIFVPINGAPGYSVSPAGVVMRKGSVVPHRRNPFGTMMVTIVFPRGFTSSRVVARLVGRAFSPDFSDGKRADYRDGDRANVAVDNLLWVEPAALCRPPRGSSRRTARFTEADILAIRASSEPIRRLAETYRTTTGYISQIRRRRFWAHI